MNKDELIDLVFNTPAVWDKRHKQHHNRHFLIREWKKIATKVGATEKDVRNCWKNLRQEFGKQLKKNENLSGDATHDVVGSLWPYFTKLLFLQDQFTPRKTTVNFIGRSDELSNLSVNNPIDSDFENFIKSDDDNSMASTSISTQNVTSSLYISDHAFRVPTPIEPPAASSSSFHHASDSGHPTTKTGYKNRITPQAKIGKQLLDLEREKLALKMSKTSHDYNDEDVGFFNSLLPHVKKLSPRDKFIFRMKVQQTLFELAFPQEQSAQHGTSFSAP